MRSRAVLRVIEPSKGEPESFCATCKERISFRAKHRANRVIANVYVDGQWDRTEHFHEECYPGTYGDAGKAPSIVKARA